MKSLFFFDENCTYSRFSPIEIFKLTGLDLTLRRPNLLGAHLPVTPDLAKTVEVRSTHFKICDLKDDSYFRWCKFLEKIAIRISVYLKNGLQNNIFYFFILYRKRNQG